MAVTVTSFQAVPFFGILGAIQRTVTVDDVQTSSQIVAILPSISDAHEDISTLQRYNTTRWED